MVRISTDEEKRLTEIFEPYFDYEKCLLKDNAPPEAVEALKKFRELGKEETALDNI